MKSLYESLLDDEDVLVDKLDTKTIIEEWLQKYSIKNYKINKDNTIDVKGSILLYQYPESELPSYIQFGKVVYNFFITGSNLKTLKGCPKEVGRSFSCSECTSLTSLEGAPQEVDNSFDCYGCISLTSLEGGPKIVKGGFSCSKCESLTSLEGGPKIVKGEFSCHGCKNLTSLKGAPEKVNGNFDCSYCDSLTSLKGVPKVIGGNFDCSYCQKLKDTREDINKMCTVKKHIYI